MEYNLYCVRDEKMTSNLYGAIMLQENDAVAMRGFGEQVVNSDSYWTKYPSDYSLWCVGTYYCATGEIQPELRKVCDASQFVRRESE